MQACFLVLSLAWLSIRRGNIGQCSSEWTETSHFSYRTNLYFAERFRAILKKSVFFWFTPLFRLLGLGVLLPVALAACSFPGSTPDVPAVPTAIGSDAYMSPSLHNLKGVQQGMVTVFTLPAQAEIKNLVSIQSNVWFGEYNSNRIGKLNAQGQLSEYALPTANSQPGWGTSGLGGDFWFSEEGANQIAKVSSQGDVTEYAIPTVNAKPGQMLLWGNAVWFAETGTHKLGRIDQSNQIVEILIGWYS